MRLRWLSFVVFAGSLAGAGVPVAWGVSCTTQSQMTQAERAVYEQAVRRVGSEIQAGNVAAVRADTIASVAAKFDPLAASMAQVAPEIQKATLTVDALYSLKATDLQPGSGNAEFFCSVPNSPLLV